MPLDGELVEIQRVGAGLRAVVSHELRSRKGAHHTGDDSQLLLYDLTEPLPLPASESKSHSKSSTHTPSTGLSPSPAPSSNVTSRSGTPASNGPSPELGPVRAWTAGQEINNLAWTHNGDSVGCVSGNTLSVLKA